MKLKKLGWLKMIKKYELQYTCDKEWNTYNKLLTFTIYKEEFDNYVIDNILDAFTYNTFIEEVQDFRIVEIKNA